MKFLKLKSLLFVAMLGSLFASCEETAEMDEYANWKERNIEYLETIAKQAEANADGKWLRILSFKLDSIDAQGNLVQHDVDDYIYCHVEYDSVGVDSPKYTDFVSVNYRGRMIPADEGKVFDESYKGTFNPTQSVCRRFYVNELIVGWSTALMKMTKGDTWRIYIPAELGYGSQKKGDIPAHSVLVFDLNLVDFQSI